MDVKQEVLDIVKEYIDIPAEDINIEEGLKFAVGIDSFVMFSMVGNIEDRFHISIPNDKLQGFKTLGDIISFIEDNL